MLTSLHTPCSFVVMTASAKMPTSCWGRYGRVALVRVQPGCRAPGCIRDTKTAAVLETWERCHVGGPRSAFGRAVAQAEAKVAEAQAIEDAWATVGSDVY